MVNIQEKLDLVRFRINDQPHIILDKNRCAECRTRPCLFCCPAGLFTLSGNEVIHTCLGCLECGTCYVICANNGIDWNYPDDGFGVSFREA